MIKRINKVVRGQERRAAVLKRVLLIASIIMVAILAYTILSAGIFSAQNSDEVVYCEPAETRNITAEGCYQLDDCEDIWATPAHNVRAFKDTDIYVEGTASTNLIISGSIRGIIGYADITRSNGHLDLSGGDSVTFWIKSDRKLADGILELRLSENTDGTGTTENLAIPGSAFDITGWNKITVNLSGITGNYDAIKSIALYAVSDPGTVSIWLDIIETQPTLNTSRQAKTCAREMAA